MRNVFYCSEDVLVMYMGMHIVNIRYAGQSNITETLSGPTKTM